MKWWILRKLLEKYFFITIIAFILVFDDKFTHVAGRISNNDTI